MKTSSKKSNTETSDPIPVDNRKQKSANQISNILERVSDAIVALDSNWIYTYVNKKAAQTFGRTPDQMIGKHIWTEFPEGIGQPFYKAYYRAVEKQQVITLEEYYPPYDRWFENRIYPSKDGLTILFNDITERKKAEQTFRDTNLYNRLLFDRSPIGLALCRMDGSLVDVNEAYAKMIGYTRDETLNLTYWDITPEKYNDQEQIQLKSLETHGEYGLYEKEYIHKDGHLVPVLLSGVIIEIANERFILSTVEDLTQRKRQDQISRQQKAFIDSLANTIPAIIYIYDIETQSNIYSNDGIQQLLQYSPQEILKKGSDLFGHLIHPQDLPAVSAFQSKLENVQDDVVLDYEYRMQDAKGVWHWLHSYERPFLRKPDGMLKQKIGIAIDITERKRIEHQIELERYFTDEILESLPGIFYMYDENLHFYRWNKNFQIVSGYTDEEIYRMSPLDFFTGQERTLLAERIHEVFETGSSSVTADFISKDGSHTPHFFTGRTFSIDHQLYLIGVGIDISEQQRAQQILQRNEEILRLFVEHSPAAIAMFDTEMRYLVASNRYRADYDLGEQNLIGRSHYDVFPEMPERWKDIHKRCLAGAIEKCEEDPFPRADGRVDWVRWEIHPWYEKTDKIGGIILFSEVVTERVKANEEIRLISARLAETQETERKTLAKELHDRVGQNLTVLSINLNILRSQLDPLKSESLCSQIESALELVTEITDQIREVMAELHPPVLEDYGLAAAIRWYGQKMSQRTGLPIEVRGEIIQPRLDLFESIALFRISQEALTNISKHARASKALVTIEENQGQVLLSIEDDGIGFNPSQLTVNNQPHWGLGTLRERARAIGGNVDIQSSPGRGTKIIVTFSR